MAKYFGNFGSVDDRGNFYSPRPIRWKIDLGDLAMGSHSWIVCPFEAVFGGNDLAYSIAVPADYGKGPIPGHSTFFLPLFGAYGSVCPVRIPRSDLSDEGLRNAVLLSF